MLETGVIVSGYRIDGVIGQGGMGVVYEATQLSLSRMVALKVLAERLSSDDAFRERFRREGVVQAALDNPHIVTVYDTGESPHGLYLAMRLVRGGNLKDLILDQQLDAHRAVLLLGQVASALDAAHEAGLVHRDIKPQNILVGAGDHAYLADFGLTKALGSRGVTRTGEFMGSVDYMSPEQIRGSSPSFPSDIYAFAAVMYEALTGAVPYPKDTDAAVIFAHVEDDPPSVTAARPELPAALDDVIARAMAKDPDERPKSATEVVQAAETALGPLRHELEAPVPIELPEKPQPRPPAPPTRVTPSRAETEAAPTDDLELPELKAPTPATVTRWRGLPTRVRRRAEPTRATPRPQTIVSRPTSRTGPALERRQLAVVLLVAAVVAGVAAGVALGMTRGDSTSTAGPRTGGVASAGGLNLRYPSTWAPRSAPSIAGLRLRRPIALAPGSGGPDVGLVAGYTSASGPTLLPPAFTELVDGKLDDRERVLLGGLQSYRYSRLEHEDLGDRVDVYVAPTTRGVATIACFAQDADTSFEDCEHVAGSLRLTLGRAYALGPVPSFAGALNSTITTLTHRRTEALSRMQKARTPSAVASELRRLGLVYRTAGRRLASRKVSPELEPANDRIAATLKRAAGAYAGLAKAAAASSEARYSARQREVRSAEQALNGALSSLGQLGYAVG